MAEIIYLKDVLLARAGEKTRMIKKSSSLKTKMKSIRYGKLLKSSLMEKQKEDKKRR